MSDVKELLERHYQSFIHEEVASTFFLGLADYLRFAYKNPQIRALLEDLKKQQIAEYTNIKKIEDATIKELDKAEKTLRKIQSKQTMDTELTSALFEQYQEYRTEKKVSSATQPAEMERVLFELAVEISKKDPEYVKQFLDLNPDRPNVYGNYKFSQSLKSFLTARQELADSKAREIWAALYYLTVIAMVVMKGKPEFDDMYTYEGKTQYQLTSEGADYFRIQAEWDRLKKTSITIKDFEYLVRSRSYVGMANRLHLYLITQLSQDNQSYEKLQLNFDEDKSVLAVNGKAVKIRKHSDQYHLLCAIINEPFREWFYSEIAEEYDVTGNTKDKKYANAAYQLKQKIKRDTDVKDLILTTNQTIQFNPKYKT